MTEESDSGARSPQSKIKKRIAVALKGLMEEKNQQFLDTKSVGLTKKQIQQRRIINSQLKKSLMEQAKENIDEKLTTQAKDVKSLPHQIQMEYKKLDKIFKNSIGFLKDEILEEPDKFDNDYRNLYSFVKLKQNAISKNQIRSQNDFDYYAETQKSKKRFQELIAKHDIKIDRSQISPFNERIEKMCSQNNAFLTYKSKRVEIFKDKIKIPKEPYHQKILREQKEQKERAAQRAAEAAAQAKLNEDSSNCSIGIMSGSKPSEEEPFSLNLPEYTFSPKSKLDEKSYRPQTRQLFSPISNFSRKTNYNQNYNNFINYNIKKQSQVLSLERLPEMARPTTQLESNRFFTNRKSLNQSIQKMSFFSPRKSPMSHLSSEKLQVTKNKYSILRNNQKYRKPSVSKVSDKEIQELIKKYPLKKEIEQEDNSADEEAQDTGELQKFRQKNANIARICQNVEIQTQQELNNINVQKALLKLKSKETMNLSSFISEIDFSSPSAFQLLYAFKKKDHNSVLALGQEIAEEYQIERDNPQKIMHNQLLIKELRKYKKRQKEQSYLPINMI